jgi:AcrR family transcriptional regulator
VARHSRESGVRDRLLDAADRLFYKEGVRAVGIDRVLAEADAAKASLYSHFRCKDELVAAYVERRVSAAREQIETYVASVPPAQRAVRFFDWVVTWVESPGFRGCPLQHVVGELSDLDHPARKVAAAQRKWLLARFTEWARAARSADPAATAGALMVLFDGAVAASEQDGPQRARDARRAVERLLAPRASAR